MRTVLGFFAVVLVLCWLTDDLHKPYADCIEQLEPGVSPRHASARPRQICVDEYNKDRRERYEHAGYKSRH